MAISNIPDVLQQYQKFSDNQAAKTQNPFSNPLDEKLAEYGVSASTSYTKVEQQASMVSHLFGDTEQSIQTTLRMTYQAAITSLNEILAPEVGENAISSENLEAQGGMEYWSPENTSQRILDGATGFLEGFKSIHPELEGEELMAKFDEVVGSGLRRGFEEAQSILDDLKVFDGLVKENFDSTFNLVEQGLVDFRNQYLGIIPETGQTDQA